MLTVSVLVLGAVSAFVALDSAYNVYMTYISDSYGAVKATPTQ